MELQGRYPGKTFVTDDMFNAFISMRAVAFHTTHGQNIICGFSTEGYAPVASLCDAFGSQSWFIKSLIGKTGNI